MRISLLENLGQSSEVIPILNKLQFGQMSFLYSVYQLERLRLNCVTAVLTENMFSYLEDRAVQKDKTGTFPLHFLILLKAFLDTCASWSVLWIWFCFFIRFLFFHPFSTQDPRNSSSVFSWFFALSYRIIKKVTQLDIWKKKSWWVKRARKWGFGGSDKNLIHSHVFFFFNIKSAHGLLTFSKNCMSAKKLVLELWPKNL